MWESSFCKCKKKAKFSVEQKKVVAIKDNKSLVTEDNKSNFKKIIKLGNIKEKKTIKVVNKKTSVLEKTIKSNPLKTIRVISKKLI